MNRDLAHYMELGYTVVVRRDDEGDYVARIEELPGCSAHASTPAEAFRNVVEAQRLWIVDAIEAGHSVPEPEEESLPSGKWIQRVPRSLHGSLTKLAKRENVSLNQLVVSVLSEAVAAKSWVEVIAGCSGFYERRLHTNLDCLDPWDFGSKAEVKWVNPSQSRKKVVLDTLPFVQFLAAATSQQQSFPVKDAYKKEISEYSGTR